MGLRRGSARFVSWRRLEDQVDGGDPAVLDGAAHHADTPLGCLDDQARGAVDRRRARVGREPAASRQGLAGHLLGTDRRRACTRVALDRVEAEDDVGVEHLEQCLEVTGAGGCKECVDDAPLLLGVGVGGGTDPRTRRRARLASWRAASGLRPEISPISLKGTPNMSCSTKATRSAGERFSSTTSIASPIESASSTSSAGFSS